MSWQIYEPTLDEKKKKILEKIRLKMKDELKNNGVNWNVKYTNVFNDVVGWLMDDELKPLVDMIDEADRGRKVAEQARKDKDKYTQLFDALNELHDDRAKEALKFAQKMGDVFEEHPEHAEQISYSVWAYLGAVGKPGDC